MRVVLDAGLCAGYGNCVMLSQEVFDLPDGASVVTVAVDEIASGAADAVADAAMSCPTGALSIEP